MTKLEAVKKNYGSHVEFLDNGYGVERFEDNGAIYSIYDDYELETYARENIEQLFRDCYTADSLSRWVDNNGGFENFYNEEWINDIRIEDSETFGDMPDEVIIDALRDAGCLEELELDTMVDMEKLVNYVWDIDGAEGLSLYDGKLHYCDGYTVIREEQKMDLSDLKFNPEFKSDYDLTLNNSVGHRSNIVCFCQKHRCFVTKKQIKSGNRHCNDPAKDGTLSHCVYCIYVDDDNWPELKKQSALEEKIKEYCLQYERVFHKRLTYWTCELSQV